MLQSFPARGGGALSGVRAILLPGMHHRTRRPRDLRRVLEADHALAADSAQRFCRRDAALPMLGRRGDDLVFLLFDRRRFAPLAHVVSRGNPLGSPLAGSKMKPLNHRQRGKNGIGLIEEATHLLRLAPAGAWASYYLGSLPFLLGLLYFWADMSRSPFAYQHLVGEAFGMSLLFIWMKCWQTVFARRLRAHLAREPA